ncbi:aminotransferase class I/II-fold pyridoxal phosphate-dependent enzyme [Salinimicrobium sp. WS361]|uniref:aminotransferase class I/II-fold pyridoxal phosphate-dependent enzyme n=1 Tax=Salinimicrobium sp. WS361 TaxID=3425123 RepID=UPI003D6DFE1F
MAKIKHNNFLDTVDEVISNATEAGVIHLNAEGDHLNGRKIKIRGKESYHFGTTGYLGLEQDMRLKKAAVDAILKYGTQFPLSKTYISHPLYSLLEEKMTAVYNHPVIITKNSTLGHMAVIPTAVRDEDAVILDHQVHWSVQNAAQILKTRGIPVSLIRHNSLEMLETRIREFSDKAEKIWYMADGVYSMYGDFAPIEELMELCKKYPQLHLYFDDVHGMSWKGSHGAGYVMSVLNELPENVLLVGTLSKTFGASGAVVACSNKSLFRKIKNFGGPLTFSAQLEPASVAAAIASAEIHLSDEIYDLQSDLQEKIRYFNQLLSQTVLPLISVNESPVFYIGTGLPATGYNFVNRLMNEGFFVNLGLYPAVPVKNTGVRITISRHNQLADIKALSEAMEYHYPLALEETGNNFERVGKAFRLEITSPKTTAKGSGSLEVQYENTIFRIPKEEWNKCMGGKGAFDWDGQLFLEKVFNGNEKREHQWSFHYFIIRDEYKNSVLSTFLSISLWKDDMTAPASVSKKLEETRERDPYFMTSPVLSLGSTFTEGEHLFIKRKHPRWEEALKLLLQEIEKLSEKVRAEMVVLRDFEKDDTLARIFNDEGYIPAEMPESCVLEGLDWKDEQDYMERLSSRSRRHFRKEVQPYEDKFDIRIVQNPHPGEIEEFYQLYKNVKQNNYGINTFTYPQKLFFSMADSPNWEFIVLKLHSSLFEGTEPPVVGVMFCYKNLDVTYVPSLVGMDYKYATEFQVYRQLLYQTIKRAKDLGFKRIDFGLSASFEKRKFGATVKRRLSYVQTEDNYKMESIGMMRNES